PSISGIVTSSSTRSGGSWATAASASRPLVTGRTSKPWEASIPASRRRFSAGSSPPRVPGPASSLSSTPAPPAPPAPPPPVAEVVGQGADRGGRIRRVFGHLLGQACELRRARLVGRAAQPTDQLVGNAAGQHLERRRRRSLRRGAGRNRDHGDLERARDQPQ